MNEGSDTLLMGEIPWNLEASMDEDNRHSIHLNASELENLVP